MEGINFRVTFDGAGSQHAPLPKEVEQMVAQAIASYHQQSLQHMHDTLRRQDERIQELTRQVNEYMQKASRQQNERLHELSRQANENIQKMFHQLNENIHEASRQQNERIQEVLRHREVDTAGGQDASRLEKPDVNERLRRLEEAQQRRVQETLSVGSKRPRPAVEKPSSLQNADRLLAAQVAQFGTETGRVTRGTCVPRAGNDANPASTAPPPSHPPASSPPRASPAQRRAPPSGDSDLGRDLCKAAANGDIVETVRLLNAGAGVTHVDPAGKTAFQHATQRGHRAVVARLLDAGADIDRPDDQKETPLMKAAYNGHLTMVSLLLQRGADINRADAELRTPLMRAVYNGHHSVMALLLQRGADVQRWTSAGTTALHFAVHTDDGGRSTRLLLDAGAPKDARDADGYTPLHWAAANKNEAAMKALLAAGARVRMRDHRGCTALHVAAKNNHEAGVRLLLDAGRWLDDKDNEGRTPLQYAREERVRALLRTKPHDSSRTRVN